MNYFDPIKLDNQIYSVDRIRANFYLDSSKAEVFSRFLTSDSQSYITSYPENNASFKYKKLYSLSYNSESVLTLGISFNGVSENYRTDVYKGYLDFNPNKIANEPKFWEDYRFIKSCFRLFEIARIDLAIDISIPRNYLILEKDKRHYVLSAYSENNKTEYLGQRSNVGFVKIYNKTVESKLDYDLSRIELTIEPNIESFFKHVPTVYDISLSNQLSFEIESLNDTDKFILWAEWQLLTNGLDNGLMSFKSIGRKKYEKLRSFLLPDDCKVQFSRSAVSQAISNMLLKF